MDQLARNEELQDLERGLVEHVRDFLLELGAGSAFMVPTIEEFEAELARGKPRPPEGDEA